MPLVAGVDSSTQSTKVEIRDLATGEVISSSSAPHPDVTPPVSEQDPDAWWSAFENAWTAVGRPLLAMLRPLETTRAPSRALTHEQFVLAICGFCVVYFGFAPAVGKGGGSDGPP